MSMSGTQNCPQMACSLFCDWKNYDVLSSFISNIYAHHNFYITCILGPFKRDQIRRDLYKTPTHILYRLYVKLAYKWPYYVNFCNPINKDFFGKNGQNVVAQKHLKKSRINIYEKLFLKSLQTRVVYDYKEQYITHNSCTII